MILPCHDVAILLYVINQIFDLFVLIPFAYFEPSNWFYMKKKWIHTSIEVTI